jgi:hypothetical protein
MAVCACSGVANGPINVDVWRVSMLRIMPDMHRLGFAVLLAAATLACDKSQTPPTQEPEPAVDAPPQPEPEAEPEPEPEPEPAPAAEPEVSEFKAETFSEGGFEARNLNCSFDEASSKATGYVKASLVDADAALDACAPKGAAIEVSWDYVGGPVGNISVVAENQKVANCVGAAMSKNVSAGLHASCTAVFLIGDTAGATASFEKRKK